MEDIFTPGEQNDNINLNVILSAEFKRKRRICSNSALQFDSVPPIDRSFLRAQEETINANISLPQMVEDTLSVSFPIGNSPLYLDPLSLELSADLRIVESDGKKLTESYRLFVVNNIFQFFFYFQVIVCQHSPQYD